MPTAKRPGWFVAVLCACLSLWAMFGAHPSAQPGFKFTALGELITGGGTTATPVSGTVTANGGTAPSQANRWPVCLSDGTNCLSPDTQLQQNTAFTLANATGPAQFQYAVSALPTAVTATRPVMPIADKFGRQVTLPVTLRDLTGTQTTTLNATTSETTIVTAAASTFNDLVMLIISNTSASTNTRIDFRDTTGGSVLFSMYSVAAAPPTGFALPVPIPQTSVNTNWTAQCATSTADVRIYAVYAKNQ